MISLGGVVLPYRTSRGTLLWVDRIGSARVSGGTVYTRGGRAVHAAPVALSGGGPVTLSTFADSGVLCCVLTTAEVEAVEALALVPAVMELIHPDGGSVAVLWADGERPIDVRRVTPGGSYWTGQINLKRA